MGRDRHLHRLVERQDIAYFIDDECEVLALVFDADGERVVELVDGNAQAATQAHSCDDFAAQVHEAHDVDRTKRDRRHGGDAENGLGVENGEAKGLAACEHREVALVTRCRDIRDRDCGLLCCGAHAANSMFKLLASAAASRA